MKITLLLILLLNFQSMVTVEIKEFKSTNFIGVEHYPVATELNRAQAQQYCRSKYGTDLATILKTADQTEIKTKILPHFPTSTIYVYVGFRDWNGIKVWEPCNAANCKNNNWECSANDETTANWHEKEATFGRNQCGTLKRTTGKWHALSCNGQRDFICNNPSGKYKTPPISCGAPTKNPTKYPTTTTSRPTKNPTTLYPSETPSENPTVSPTKNPSLSPTKYPSNNPTKFPSVNPSTFPTISPTKNPSLSPTKFPSDNPTKFPSVYPSGFPSVSPTKNIYYESNNYIGVAERLNADNAFQFCYGQFGTGLAVIMDNDDQMEIETEILKQMYEDTGGHVVHFGYRDYNGVAKWFVEGTCSAKDVLDEIWHSTATSPHKNQCGFINLAKNWSLHWDIGSCSLRRYFVCNNPKGKYKTPCGAQK